MGELINLTTGKMVPPSQYEQQVAAVVLPEIAQDTTNSASAADMVTAQGLARLVAQLRARQ